MDDLRYNAARDAVKKLDLKSKETFLIIYNDSAVKIAASLMTAAEMINGKGSSAYCLDAHQPRNGKGFKFNADLRRHLEEVDVSFFVTCEMREGEVKNLREPMMDFIRSRPELRHAHAPEITEDDFLRSNIIDYDKSRA